MFKLEANVDFHYHPKYLYFSSIPIIMYVFHILEESYHVLISLIFDARNVSIFIFFHLILPSKTRELKKNLRFK